MKGLFIKYKEKSDIINKIAVIAFVFTIIFVSICQNSKNDTKIDTNSQNEVIEYHTANEKAQELENEIYLSDLEPKEARVGYGKLLMDKTTDSGDKITLKVENNYFAFNKGIFAHATSKLVYDISEYNDQYKHLTAFIGLNRTSNAGNGVTYYFYTAGEDKEYTQIGTEIKKLPGENATFIDVPLKEGTKYIQIIILDNGANGNDHSVLADAKLVKTVERNFVLPSEEELNDNIINLKKEDVSNSDLEIALLKKELVKRVGQYTINSFYNASDANKETIKWLTSNLDVLRYYILGGTPSGGSYYNSLTELSKLYAAYKNDFTNQTLTTYKTSTLGDLYTRMAISLSLTHSQLVGLWMQPGVKANQSEAVNRYKIFKELYLNNKFKVTDTMDMTKWFERYTVEEMRFVMGTALDDESILWLNEYTQQQIDNNPSRAWSYLTPHPYMAYVWPNYSNDLYYTEENKAYFDELFKVGNKTLDDYGITRGTLNNKVHKIWMNFRNKFGTGAVCGGISKTGSNIRPVHGIAATVIGQPGHAALLYYTQDDNGDGYWRIDNDVSGWTLSEKGERLLLDWGNANTKYARGNYQVVYMHLSQEAINDYDNLVKAEEQLMLARAYNDNPTKKEALINEALKTQSINLDAWLELIELYNASNTKTENDYYNLAERIAENLKYYPLPMYNLTNLIKPKLTSVENTYKFSLLQTRILKEGSSTPNNTDDSYTTYQPGVTRLEANFLLGKTDNSMASFSFDGADAGKIVMSSRFDNSGIRVEYSLDGKKTWKTVSFTADEPHKIILTKKELDSIDETNDININIVGVPRDDKTIFKIDITKGSLPADVYASDLENRVIGVNLSTEWRYNENMKWVSYGSYSPDLTGDKTVQIRQAASGTKLASDVSETYIFTKDDQPDTRKYIPVSHLSIAGVSTEATSQGKVATNAIDGNYNTIWHSAWNGTDTERYIIIKLDKPVNLSAIEFVPAGGGNGKIYDGTIYGSSDNKTWEEIASAKNLTYTNQANTLEQAKDNIKTFNITSSKTYEYVKIVSNRSSNGNWFTARAFNLYQDITKNPHPTAGIAYSTTESTNERVIARLVNPSKKIKITNNSGSDSYVFDKNGSFTFEFEDDAGNKGSATATVTWIDKSLPSADIDYNVNDEKKMYIVLDNITEDVYLLDKNNKKLSFLEVKDGHVDKISYLDDKEEITKLVELDSDGNIIRITYNNASSILENVSTYVTIIKNGEVSKEEYFDEAGNSITLTDEEMEKIRTMQQPIDNPLKYTFENSGDYEFKLVDKASNIAIKSIKVDYYGDNSDKFIVSDITYDKTKLTNSSVIATINAYVVDSDGNKKDAKITEKTHEFKENGIYAFKYQDGSDANDYHAKEHIAEVTWIDNTPPTAEIVYKKKDNSEVEAILTKESEPIIIINNNGNNSYTFTENGSFTFEFEDMAGNRNKVTAKVDSIIPKLSLNIVYSPMNPTSNPVLATLISNHKLKITNNDGKNYYTFTRNGIFTFMYIDEFGNEGNIDAKVDWIIEAKPDDKKDDDKTDDKTENNNSNNTKPSDKESPTYVASGGSFKPAKKENVKKAASGKVDLKEESSKKAPVVQKEAQGKVEEHIEVNKPEEKTEKVAKIEESEHSKITNFGYITLSILIIGLVARVIITKKH